MAKMIKGLKVLERSDFERFAPSFYATQPKDSMSDRYAFLNSRDIAAQLWKSGWVPTYAREKRSNKASNRGFNKHIVRFSHPDMKAKNGDRIELVSVNSHNGISSYQFYAGVFSLICLNGLIAQTSDLGSFRVIHKGSIQAQVQAAIDGIAAGAGSIASSMDGMQAIVLDKNEQQIFAETAHEFVYGDQEVKENRAPIKAERLLTARHAGRRDPNLWNTFNNIQENLMRGGLRGYNRNTYRRVTTRKITSIDKDIKLNKTLWTMAEGIKEYKMKVINADGTETEITKENYSLKKTGIDGVGDFSNLLTKKVANY